MSPRKSSFARGLLWVAAALALSLGVDRLAVQWINPYFYRILVLCGLNVMLALSLNLVNGITGQFSIGHAGFMAVGAYASAAFTVYAVPGSSASARRRAASSSSGRSSSRSSSEG